MEDWRCSRRRNVPTDLVTLGYHGILRGHEILETSRRDANKSGIPGE